MDKIDGVYHDLFTSPEKKFIEHLKIENNERIIFSGKFGTGKTTFLKHFFSDPIQEANFKKKKYNVVSISPVNYSIASNEDIIKYIKYDIILEMLLNNYEGVVEYAVNYLDTLPKFLLTNIHKVLASFVAMIPQIGKSVIDGFERLDKLKEEYFKIHNKAKNALKENDLLLDYVNAVKEKEGSIFEDDIVTRLIEAILKNKSKENKTQTILLIDDLDRIDPEHIFRILNVFAAHFDRKHPLDSKNKFGFDKIIIVCDINNVRQIFKSKFGIKTDFNGYIDKFFSHRVFEFNNKETFREIASKLIYEAKWSEYQHANELEEKRHSRGLTYKSQLLTKQSFFTDMIDILYNNNQLDLRNIVKYNYIPIQYQSYYRINNQSFDIEEFPIIFYLHFLSQIKGGYDSLKETLAQCNDMYLDHNKIYNYISELVFILVSMEHRNVTETIEVVYKINDRPVNCLIKNSLLREYRLHGHGSAPLYFTEKDLLFTIDKVIDLLASQGSV